MWKHRTANAKGAPLGCAFFCWFAVPCGALELPRCARRGFRCAPRLRRAPQSGDAHSKRATGATCPFGTNGVPIRAVASRPLWIPRRESPCDPARRAGILRERLRRMPGARYARRPISGLRAAFGGWPPKRGLRTAVAGAPPRDPGLSPLRGPGPMSRNSKRDLREYLAITRRLPSLPTGTPAEGSIRVAGAPND